MRFINENCIYLSSSPARSHPEPFLGNIRLIDLFLLDPLLIYRPKPWDVAFKSARKTRVKFFRSNVKNKFGFGNQEPISKKNVCALSHPPTSITIKTYDMTLGLAGVSNSTGLILLLSAYSSSISE